MSPSSQPRDGAHPSEEPSFSPIALIRDIQRGNLSPSSLSAEARQACVEHLSAEGYRPSEMAEIFKVTTRTIQRDLEAIRESHSVERSPILVGQTVGDIRRHAELAISKLMRFAGDPACPHAQRIEATRNAWTVRRELVESLQRLGYLPTVAQQMHADITHRAGLPDLRQLAGQVQELEQILAETGSPADGLMAQLDGLKQELKQLDLGDRIGELAQRALEPGGDGGNDD
jgi:transposase